MISIERILNILFGLAVIAFVGFNLFKTQIAMRVVSV